MEGFSRKPDRERERKSSNEKGLELRGKGDIIFPVAIEGGERPFCVEDPKRSSYWGRRGANGTEKGDRSMIPVGGGGRCIDCNPVSFVGSLSPPPQKKKNPRGHCKEARSPPPSFPLTGMPSTSPSLFIPPLPLPRFISGGERRIEREKEGDLSALWRKGKRRRLETKKIFLLPPPPPLFSRAAVSSRTLSVQA